MACAVLWLLAATLRHMLSAPQSADFVSILLTPFLVAARWAAEVPADTGWWLALGVLLIGALWHFIAPVVKRRGSDAILAALFSLQIFWVLRWQNSRLPVAGPPQWDGLSSAQQASLVLGGLLILFLSVAWLLLPAARASYENSAPSRVTSFMKKRRMPARIVGAALMALAIGLVALTVFQLSEDLTNPVFFGFISAPLLFALWIALDTIYYLGRRMWQRLT